MSDKYNEVFDKEFKNGKGDAMTRFHNATKKATEAMLSELPVYMKLNYIANTMGDKKDSDIDWKKVNKMLSNSSSTDFNCFNEINTMEEFMQVRENCIMASLGLGPWRQGTCKECGKTFYLNYNEIEFYKEKELKIPKRCEYCRKGKQRPVTAPKKEIKKEPEIETKTDLQIALEKAGFTS